MLEVGREIKEHERRDKDRPRAAPGADRREGRHMRAADLEQEPHRNSNRKHGEKQPLAEEMEAEIGRPPPATREDAGALGPPRLDERGHEKNAAEQPDLLIPGKRGELVRTAHAAARLVSV